eukprot:s523_g4.t1
MPDSVSRAIICAISEYRHWPRLPGVEQDAQLGLRVLCNDLGATEVTTTLAGHVTHDDLKRGFNEVIQDLEASKEEFPVLVVLVSCHAVQIGEGIFPHLIPSDSPTGEEGASRAAFNFEEHVFKPLKDLKFNSRKAKKMRAILIFDCCRNQLLDSQQATRGLRNLLPCLKHDFYTIFSCDQGRPSSDGPESGGPLMSVLLPSLRYAKPIYEIFANASCQVSSQRPNDHNRMGLPIPILGSHSGDPPGWVLGSRDQLGDDLNQVAVLVLSGITGHGKSTLGNALTERENFRVSSGLSSETKFAKHEDMLLDGKKYRVIDTPGFNDTDLSTEENWSRFAEFADLAPAGIDVFLHLVEWGRFNEEKARALRCLQEVAGEGCTSHVLLVFSKAPPDFHRQIVEAQKQNEHLKHALESVSFTGVNCSGTELKEAQQTIMANVQSLIETNRNRKHSNGVVAIANTSRRELLNVMQQLHEPDAHEVRGLIDQVYNGKLKSLEALDRARDKLMRQRTQRCQHPMEEPQGSGTIPTRTSGFAGTPPERSHEVVGQMLDTMKMVGAYGQAQADQQDSLAPQLFMRGWRGAVGFFGDVLAKDREKKLKEEELKEEERLKKKRKEEKLKENLERFKGMGFPQDRIELALRNSEGDFEKALDQLLSENDG